MNNTALHYAILTASTDQAKTLVLVDGKVVKSSVANPTRGHFLACAGSLSDFANTLNTMTVKQSLIVGAVHNPNGAVLAVGNKISLTTVNNPKPNHAARCKDHIRNIKQSGFLLFDIDGNSAGLDEITAFIPELSGVGAVVKPSSSSMIYDKDGVQLVGAKGLHIYVPIVDMSDAERVAAVFWGRMWLAGHGHYLISAGVNPMLLERGLFDATVLGKSERLSFEARPVLKDGLTQRDNVAVVVDGGVLDTALIADLTAVELAEIAILKQAARELVRPTHERVIATKKAAFIAKGNAAADYDGLSGRVLPRDFMVETAQGLFKVGDLDGSHNNLTMRDPFEPDYDGGSVTKAKFYWNDGKPVINSQAHGGVKYTIKAATKPAFADWLIAKQLNSPEAIYSFFFSNIKEAAAAVGVAFVASDLSVARSGKNNNVLPLVSGDDSKLCAFVTLENHHGVTFPEFRFSTTKDNGLDIRFSTHSAAWALYNAGVLPVGKLTAGKATVAKVLKEQTPAVSLQTPLQKENRVAELAKEYAAASGDLAESYYLHRAFTSFVPAHAVLGSRVWSGESSADYLAAVLPVLKDAGVRYGVDDKGGFLIVRLQNKSDKAVGYQKIYDVEVNLGERGNQLIDGQCLDGSRASAFLALGTAAAKFDDYVFVAHDLLSGVAVFLATGKPVFVAMTKPALVSTDKVNVKTGLFESVETSPVADVLKVVKGFGYKRAVIAAGNHALGKGGNAFVWSALKAAKTHGARVFVSSGTSFYDVLLKHDMATLKAQLKFKKNPVEVVPEQNVFDGALQLLGVCPDKLVYKHTWYCAASAVSNQFDMSLPEAELMIASALVGRGVAVETAKQNAAKAVGQALYKALERCKVKNTAEFEGFDGVFDITRLDYYGYAFVKACFKRAGVSFAVFKVMVKAHGIYNVDAATRILASKGIWLDSRPMGTGKTELMGAVLALAEARNKSCSYLCHRQSLVANSSDRINATSYKVLNSMAKTHNEMSISLCVNSIINSFYNQFVTSFTDVLFIDEIRQTLEHVAVGTVKASERKAVYDTLIAAINNADTVLASDADLNQATVDWLRLNFPEKKFFGLMCDVKSPTAVIEYGHYDAVWNAAIDSINAGLNTLVQCDSSNAAMAMYHAVKHPGRKVLVITGDNKGGDNAEDTRAKQFLLNPNEEIKHYDCVIHSPVIGTGVSITCDHVQAHFALFRGILAENEVLQMIGRNRPSKKITIGFNDKHTKNRVSNAENLRDGELKARERVQGGVIVTDALDMFRISVVAARNDSLNDYAVQSLLLMRLKGYQLSRFVGDLSNDEQKTARKAAKLAHCAGVVKFNYEGRINFHEAMKLERAESLTQEESHSLEHFKIIEGLALSSASDGIGLPCVSEEDVLAWDGGRILKTIRNREIAEATRDQRKAVDIEHAGFKSVAKGFFIDGVLFEAVGKAVDQERAAWICDLLQEHHKELGALGLGNYERASKYVFRTLNNFLAHFGYKLDAKQKGAGKDRGDRVYTLVSDETIDAIVARRGANVNAFKAVCVTDDVLI